MHLKSLVISFAILAIGTAAASAATAYATTTVNLRSGGGTGYAVLDVLRPGERVEVEYCRGAWCFVEKPGPDGWVNANYLSADRYDDDDDDYFDDDDDDDYAIIRPRPRVQYSPWYRSQVCTGGSNFSFCIGN